MSRNRRIRDAYLTGMETHAALGARFGVTPGRIAQILRAQSVTKDHKFRAQGGLMLSLLRRGVPVHEIAEALGCDRDTVSARLALLGVDARAEYESRRSAFGANGRKDCNTCGRRLPLDSFHWRVSRGAKVPSGSCKRCERARLRALRQRRRAQTRGEAHDGSLGAHEIRTMLAAATRCPVCKRTMSDDEKTLDHIQPLSRGGAHTALNARIVCATCNGSKGATLPPQLTLGCRG